MTEGKSIICTILGSSNAGKSTLINQIVGSKIAITTPKLQTTRRRIMGVRMVGETQCVFVDTPGIFKPQKAVDEAMLRHAWGSVKDIDLAIVLIDAVKLLKGSEKFYELILKRLKDREVPYVVVLNKVDKIQDKNNLLKLAQSFDGDEVFFVSALSGDGVEGLLKFISSKAQFPNYLFPREQVTDMNPKDLAREIVREKLMMNLDKELPYEIMVEGEQWDEGKNNIIIKQVIYVSRETLKKIVIGDNAARIKKVNEQARGDIEKLFGKKIHLYLHVKVDKNCMTKREFLENI